MGKEIRGNDARWESRWERRQGEMVHGGNLNGKGGEGNGAWRELGGRDALAGRA